MSAENDEHEVLGLKHDGATIKRRVGESITVSLPVKDHDGRWKTEPVNFDGIKRIRSSTRSGKQWLYNCVYKMIDRGTYTIQILYRRKRVIEKIFKVTVQVVPKPVPPPIEAVYVVTKITSRQVGDSRENEYETSMEGLGIACSQEGVENLIAQKHPGVVVQWKEGQSGVRVEIQRPSRNGGREVYIMVTKEPLHW